MVGVVKAQQGETGRKVEMSVMLGEGIKGVHGIPLDVEQAEHGVLCLSRYPQIAFEYERA